MKHLFFYFFTCCYLLISAPIIAQTNGQICYDQKTFMGNEPPAYCPVAPVKTMKGNPVEVTLNGFYDEWGRLQYKCGSNGTKAGNCHAWALYIGQGGPYQNGIPFNLAGYLKVSSTGDSYYDSYTTIRDCNFRVAENYKPTAVFYKLLDEGFLPKASTDNSTPVKGDIMVIFFKNISVDGKKYPHHSAMYNGDETWSQVKSICGIFQPSVTKEAILQEYLYIPSPTNPNIKIENPDLEVVYYKKNGSYQITDGVGIIPTQCSNIRKCLSVEDKNKLSVNDLGIACAGITHTVTLSGAPSDAVVTWVGEPAANFSPSSGSGSTASFKTTSSANGKIKFTVGGPYHQIEKSSNPFIVGPYLPSSFPISGPSSARPSSSVTVYAPSLAYAQTNGYLWEAYSGYTNTLIAKRSGGNSFTFTTPGKGFKMIAVVLKVRNTCNSTTDTNPTAPSNYYISENTSTYYRTGDEEEELESLNVYPIPASQELNILLGNKLEEKYSRIELFNALGQRVITQQTQHKQLSLNVASLEPGVYFLHVSNGNKVVRVSKVVSITK